MTDSPAHPSNLEESKHRKNWSVCSICESQLSEVRSTGNDIWNRRPCLRISSKTYVLHNRMVSTDLHSSPEGYQLESPNIALQFFQFVRLHLFVVVSPNRIILTGTFDAQEDLMTILQVSTIQKNMCEMNMKSKYRRKKKFKFNLKIMVIFTFR